MLCTSALSSADSFTSNPMFVVRLDRTASVTLLHPLSRLRNGRRVPILMYHGIRERPRTGHRYYETNSSPSIFAEHMLGYSFLLQTRTVLVPAGASNWVCTYFAASALLGAYEQREDSRCLTVAASAAEYMLNEICWDDGSSIAGFSYPLAPVRGQTHNANFLATALLCRVYRRTGEEKLLAPALKVAGYALNAAKLCRELEWTWRRSNANGRVAQQPSRTGSGARRAATARPITKGSTTVANNASFTKL